MQTRVEELLFQKYFRCDKLKILAYKLRLTQNKYVKIKSTRHEYKNSGHIRKLKYNFFHKKLTFFIGFSTFSSSPFILRMSNLYIFSSTYTAKCKVFPQEKDF
jgi:hypothetical protein